MAISDYERLSTVLRQLQADYPGVEHVVIVTPPKASADTVLRTMSTAQGIVSQVSLTDQSPGRIDRGRQLPAGGPLRNVFQ